MLDIVSFTDIHLDAVELILVNWPDLRMLGDDEVLLEQCASNRARRGREKYFREVGTAVRANHQLASMLRVQRVYEDADRFAYRAYMIQRKLLSLQGTRTLDFYLISWSFQWVQLQTRTKYSSLSTRYCYLGIDIYYVLRPQFAWNEALVMSAIAFYERFFTSNTLFWAKLSPSH